MTLQATISTPATRVAAAPASRRDDRWGFLEFFVIAQVLAPAILFLPGTQVLRVPIRIFPFALSLLGIIALLRVKHQPRVHPMWLGLSLIIGYLGLMVLHPNTNTLTAGLAHAGLYAAVIAPVFWVPCLVRNDKQIFRVLAILLVCNGINSAVGVLQVIDPDRFLPREYSFIVEEQGGPLGYVTDEGKQIVRPPGLSDNPGAVCGPATTAALLGLVALTLRIGFWFKVLALIFSGLGVAAIFLSHVRTNILILGGMVLAYVLILSIQREFRRAWETATWAVGTFVLASALAVALGGSAVIERFATLIEKDPYSVYYESARGQMLQYDTMRYLTEYPLGAGLARWGMMRRYFGDESNPRSPPRWAELQWPAWALDGGWVILIVYQATVLGTVLYEYRVLRRARDLPLRRIAAIIFTVNLGTVALIFGFTPFTNQVGLMYWFMAGLLHGAVLLRRGQA